MAGVFLLDSDPSDIELQKLSHINCPAILLPYLREFITDITRRGGLAPVYLPSVNFVEMHRDLIGESKKDDHKP